MKNFISKTILFFLFLKIFIAIIYCFLPLDFPHLHRQTDTLGVSLRYFLRWMYENPTLTGTQFFPAILNSGDFNGIMAMEFPIINILTAPFFYFGPYWGRVFSGLFLVTIVTTGIFVNARIWSRINIANVNMKSVMLLFPIFSFSLEYTWRFMPDFLSVLFCYLAIGLAWHNDESLKPKRWILCFALASLGMLLKPTAIISFLILFLHPCILNRYLWVNLFRSFSWIPVSIAIALCYYTFGVKFIAEFSEVKTLFAVHMRSPLHALLGFFNPAPFYKLLNTYAFPHYSFWFIFIISIWIFIKARKRIFLALWVVAFAQIFAIGILDGAHSFIHIYYYIGAAPVFALVFLSFVYNAKFILPTILYNFLMCLFLAFYIRQFCDVAYTDLRSLFMSSDNMTYDYTACKNIKENTPYLPWDQNYVFRTEFEGFPTLGICFGERTNSNLSEYGIYEKQKIPNNCNLIETSGRYAVVRCYRES